MRRGCFLLFSLMATPSRAFAHSPEATVTKIGSDLLATESTVISALLLLRVKAAFGASDPVRACEDAVLLLPPPSLALRSLLSLTPSGHASVLRLKSFSLFRFDSLP